MEAKDEPVDIVILTNGPGEVATWVKPVVATLRQSSKEQGIDMRISVSHSTYLHPLQCERFFGHCRFCFAESLNKEWNLHHKLPKANYHVNILKC